MYSGSSGSKVRCSYVFSSNNGASAHPIVADCGLCGVVVSLYVFSGSSNALA